VGESAITPSRGGLADGRSKVFSGWEKRTKKKRTSISQGGGGEGVP